ncbi:MAG TPA: YiiD C-terminal domain-containing protein [Rhodanobacteraceae bacterium]
MNRHLELAAQLQDYILEHIPLARAMQLRVVRYDSASLEAVAPLAPNINDKGCAFGGSLASLMTLTAWGLVDLNLRERGLACDIYVGDSSVLYLQPLLDDLHATARYTQRGSFPGFFETLSRTGKARIAVSCVVTAASGDAATLEATFVAKLR